MTATATQLPRTIAKRCRSLMAQCASLYDQGTSMPVWAFAACVRLSDQNRPIALKLLVEMANVVRLVASRASQARRQTSATLRSGRATRSVKRVAVRRVQRAMRSVPVPTRPPAAQGRARHDARASATRMRLGDLRQGASALLLSDEQIAIRNITRREASHAASHTRPDPHLVEKQRRSDVVDLVERHGAGRIADGRVQRVARYR